MRICNNCKVRETGLKPNGDTYKTCSICIDAVKRYQKSHKRKGLCISCNNPASPQSGHASGKGDRRAYCKEHQARNRLYAHNRYIESQIESAGAE